MEFIDTHAHLYLEQFRGDLEAVVQNAQRNGVTKIVLPNLDKHSIPSMNDLVRRYPQLFVPMIGIHPCYVKEDIDQQLEAVKAEIDTNSYKAVGEIGLDLYWDKAFYPQQEMAFVTQCKWAKEKSWPVSIHSREATPQAISLLEPLVSKEWTGVFHCFVGNVEEARKIVEMGFYLGIGGVCTYKKGGLDKVLPSVPLERIVLETDAPYLPPEPFRGKRNESAYLTYTAKKVADIYRLPVEEVAYVTSQNAKSVFRLS